jgi:hypothetical protein
MSRQSDHKAGKPEAEEVPLEEAERAARDVARRLLTTRKPQEPQRRRPRVASLSQKRDKLLICFDSAFLLAVTT